MPPVAPTSYEALAVSYGLAMLAGSATFQGLNTAADATAAKAWIINGLGGLPHESGSDDDTVKAINCLGDAFVLAGNSWAVIHMGEPMERTLVGHREYMHTGTIDIVVTLPVLTNEAPNDLETRGRNLMGAIAADIENQFGGSGKLMNGHVTTHGPSRPDETSARKATIDFKISLHWQDV